MGRGGKSQLLGSAGELGPIRLDLLYGGLAAVLEGHEAGGHVAVQAGHPEALGGNGGAAGQHQLSIFHPAPELHRLLFALFLLAADVGDAVVHHLRPALKGFARAGDSLIGTD